MAEGPSAIEYALRKQAVRTLFVEMGAQGRYQPFLAAAASVGARIVAVDSDAMRDLAGTQSPQGIIAVATSPQMVEVPDGRRVAVLLERVTDPGNLGTILRTADAFGVDCVVLGPGCVDPRGSKVVRASAGSVLGVPIVRDADLLTVIKDFQRDRMTICATSGVGDSSFFDSSSKFESGLGWVFGNEADGVSQELADACDQLVAIPMTGDAESLNVAAAVTVCLFVSQQRQAN